MPSIIPTSSAKLIPSSVYTKPLRPARTTSCRFMPKPSPTTDACSKYFESLADSFAKGCVKSKPNASPNASAAGGDRKLLAAASNPKTKTILDVIGKLPGTTHRPRLVLRNLCGNALLERLDCFLLRVVHLEDRQQLGHLQKVAHALRQIR